ncbi:ATP-binding protein [Candidatus Woesearchaeota archaeon]|nr:ATP-binding protein [Candidatus Woesearchaeota archaeon]
MAKKPGKEGKAKTAAAAIASPKIPKNFRSTAEIQVSKNLVEQIMGQDEAVEVIKKSAEQRRNVLLIGEPGTGKSMLGLALAELLPKEKLMDILAFPNPNDENAPLIRAVPAGQGRDLVARARIQGMSMFKNQNIIFFIFILVAMFAPWWLFSYYGNKYDYTVGAIIFAASFVGSFLLLASFILFINMGKRMEGRVKIPKVIVDNFKKKQAPFHDATGAHAGALLGDVLHDPFQTFFPMVKLNFPNGKKRQIKEEIDTIIAENKTKTLRRENNYEAIHLLKNELFVMGETNGSISPVEVLSANRYDYDGKMIKLTTSKNEELIVTPEHKIAVWENGRIVYVEAKNIKERDEIVSGSEDVIIDEQDIINTYDKRQQEQCRLYYQYSDIRAQNPTWGYKKIAKTMGQNIGKTRWWYEKKHIPIPIRTATWLKSKGLIPLKIDNPKLPLIAKVLGATFGDGGVFENLNGIFLSSSEKDAVEEFGRDLEKIFGLSKNENSRIIEGGIYGHSWCYQNTNRDVIRFFLALGAPKGNKTNLELKIPVWIKLNENYENEFYGSFLGGELGTPIIHKQGNYLTSLEVGITGLPKFKENRINFLNELAIYFDRNKISTTSIYEGKSKTEGSLIFRLLIEKKIDNVILFLMNIKINYCKYKVCRLYKALGEWAKLKKEKYLELINKGYGAERVMQILNLTPNSTYLLLNHFGSKSEATA